MKMKKEDEDEDEGDKMLLAKSSTVHSIAIALP